MWQVICVCLPALTEAEQQRVCALLNGTVYDSCSRQLHAVDIGLSFLHFLKPAEILTVLEERRDLIRHAQASAERQRLEQMNETQGYIQDHIATLLAAELDWLERTILHLQIDRREVGTAAGQNGVG